MLAVDVVIEFTAPVVTVGAVAEANNPLMSKTKSVAPSEAASIDPFEVGMIAILDVTMPSKAFRVETSG
jgi:hypothetical protein